MKKKIIGWVLLTVLLVIAAAVFACVYGWMAVVSVVGSIAFIYLFTIAMKLISGSNNDK